MSVASEEKTTVALGGLGDARPTVRRDAKENSPRRLVWHTWLLTARLLRRWSRDRATVLESLVMPVVLLVALNIVLGNGISQFTGHRACCRDWRPMRSGSWEPLRSSCAPGSCWVSASGRGSWPRWRGCSSP